jgi:hypothetical protein
MPQPLKPSLKRSLVGVTIRQISTLRRKSWTNYAVRRILALMMNRTFSSLANSMFLIIYFSYIILIPSYGELEAESEAYNEGHDGDADDLALDDNVDMDSANDFDDYDIDHAEVLLRKEEIEAFS